MTLEKSTEVGSQSNWAWHMQGPYGVSTTMPLFSTAASSRFSSSTIPASLDAVYQPHLTIPHNHYAMPAATANNISYYYSSC